MNELSLKEQNSGLKNTITVLIGALLMGLLWCIRGETGWGASWGLLNAGFIFTLYLICLMGGRKKFGLGWLSITSISFMLTTPAWGTVIRQITGVITCEYEGQDYIAAYVPIYSAAFLMLCIGFGIAIFYGLLLGKAYSNRQWKLWHMLVLAAVYYAVMYISKATVSHGVLKLIQPQAGEIFGRGLVEAEQSGGIWKNYIQHFDNKEWAKNIFGGRNYFATIEIISSAIASIAAILAVRFIIKDKRSANVGLLVCCAFAIAITLADLFYFFGKGGYHGEQGYMFSGFIKAREMWEYATGFIAGGIITAGIIRMKPQADRDDIFTMAVPSVLKEILTFLFGYVVLIAVNSVRPIMERFEGSMNQLIYMVIAGLVSLGLIIWIAVTCGINVNKVDMRYYASKMLVVALVHNLLIYMFIGTEDCIAVNAINTLHVILMLCSFTFALTWAIINLVRVRRSLIQK
ncbi:MAG: hypothetical protein MJ168_01515 [Clostridia bacterium]|nr:hypothetical protein [Clostridia bacterium]